VSDERFDVYLHGFDPAHPETPRQGLARVFGLDGAQAAELLVSLPRLVKRDLTQGEAQRYLLALESLGARAELRPGVLATPEVRAVAPSMPPLRWQSSAPAPAWEDPLAAAGSILPLAADVEPEPWVTASSMPPRPSSAPAPPGWVATAELGSRHPPRSAPAPSMPLRQAYRRGGAGSLVLGVCLLAISYWIGASSLHGPPALTGLVLDGLGLLLIGRGLIRLLVTTAG
jgi:hypothetical protein